MHETEVLLFIRAPPPLPATNISSAFHLFLIQLQLTRNNAPQQQQQQPCDPQSMIVPILYDTTNNITSTIEQKMMSMAASPAVAQLLKQCMEFQVKPSECSILPCIRELVTNLAF